MFPIKTVLCPTDFSEPAREALKIAGELAAQVGAALLLVHVVPVLPALPSDPNYVFKVPEYERLLHNDADEKLAQLVSQMKNGTAVRVLVGHGDVAGEIVRIAETEKADLIVIATHGTTAWRRFVFGSVAEKVVRLAKCPVLTIRNPQEAAGT
ncbi:MAG: universal stress protein [Acidobacteriaceae bacterium]